MRNSSGESPKQNAKLPQLPKFMKFFQFLFFRLFHMALKKCTPTKDSWREKKGHTEEMVSFPQYIGIRGASWLAIFLEGVFQVWRAGRPKINRNPPNQMLPLIFFLWWFLLVHQKWATMRFKTSMKSPFVVGICLKRHLFLIEESQNQSDVCQWVLGSSFC